MDETNSISSTGALILTAAYATLVIFGSVSNGLIIATYVKWRRTMFSTPKDVLALSLAIGDFAMSLLVVPLGLHAAIYKKWTMANQVCVWYGFVSTFVGLSSMLQLAVIAVERYITLSQPNLHGVSTKRVFQAIVASWISAFVASCFPLIGWSKYTFEGYGLHCSILWDSSTLKDVSYCLFLLVFFFILPVIAIAYSYVKVYLVVRNLCLNALKIWGKQAQETKKTYEAQVKVSKQIFFVIAGFLFAWTPYALVSILKTFDAQKLPLDYHEIPSLFAKSSIAYNPILYFFTYQKLREKVFEMLMDVRRFCWGNLPNVKPVFLEDGLHDIGVSLRVFSDTKDTETTREKTKTIV